MTETMYGPPPSDLPPRTVRLVRDPDDKVVAGVCAGLGRTTGTDPVLWRVTVAVLVLFGGAGAVLYLLAWVLIPRAGAPESTVERLVRGQGVPRAAAGLLAGLAVLAVLGVAGDRDAPLVLLALLGLGFLVWRERRLEPPVPVAEASPPGWPVADAAYGPPLTYDERVGADPVWPAPVPVTPRRPRSRLGAVTLSAALLVCGVLLLAREAGAAGVTAPVVLASALLVVGAGLLVGTWYGRARWLLVPGLLLLVAVLGTHSLDRSYGYAFGDRTWTATAASSPTFRLAGGHATLDLTRLAPGDLAHVQARLGAGELVVRVPADLPVRVQAHVGDGEVARLDDQGRPAGEDLAGPRTGPVTVLDLSVRVGRVEVRRVAS